MNASKMIAVLLPLMLGACNATFPKSEPVGRQIQQDTVDATNPRARLILGGQRLVGEIALLDARIGTAGALAKGEVSVQNLSNDRYTLEYQYAWEDSEGFAIGENRVWQRFVLGPRELRSFRSVASDPKAHRFTFTVRLPDDFFIHQEKYLDRK
ncbi:MAG: YcfL family protein [Rhodocyclaceae bacterium]|nr:YcfL family protein [Rhodocyclaceae bacterium]